jgi:hypothetical protein
MRILTFSKLLVLGGTAVWAAQRFLRPKSKPVPDLDEPEGLDIIDDMDTGPHPRYTPDTPVADRGAWPV